MCIRDSHQSGLVRTRIASSLSPWLSRCNVGDIHTVAISHGEGRFVASPETVAQLAAAGQIATQYVDEAGSPSMDLSVNPNGSILAIEGITSPDGRVPVAYTHLDVDKRQQEKWPCMRADRCWHRG